MTLVAREHRRLGLFGVQQIVKKHGGKITLESREDRGKVVRLSFPAVQSSEAE